MISLPEHLFANAKQSKTIFILQKKSETAVDPFVYPLASLQDASVLMKFKENFQNGPRVLKYKIDFVIIDENA